ncbi:SDR family oxidoreductase [Protofrankia coriariae]|uniref:Short-chain dehydrogenase n=1 Tax=Protofrankia coriariae TaxID=1562887 RepID=A0ABR5F5N6_9ACTN|nr:SDR family oxidoreductase [Protofrankia coriariae]KLL11983.1 short-chain dehydrogenase [Protofrankia coriariae]
MTVDHDLLGRTAVVTGASSGIGRAVAQRLGAAGATVYLHGRTRAPMEATSLAIEAAGGHAHIATFDVRDSVSLRGLFSQAAADTGRLDIVVNNAGLATREPVLAGDDETWRALFEVNVIALLVGTQAAVQQMRRLGHGGHIVNVSSTSALESDGGVYGATKNAVNHLTRVLRTELEDEDIRVGTVAPGPVATNIVRNWDPQTVKGVVAFSGLDVDVRPGERLPDEVLDAAQAALERLIAKPGDIAEAVHYIVRQPLRLNIADLVIRPAKQLTF